MSVNADQIYDIVLPMLKRERARFSYVVSGVKELVLTSFAKALKLVNREKTILLEVTFINLIP